jgi:hypothetical protein
MSPEQQSLLVVMVLAPVAGIALHAVGAPGELTSSVVAGIFGLQPTIRSALKSRRQTKQERLIDIAVHRGDSHPVLVTLLMMAYLELTARVVGAIFGAAIGLGLASFLDAGTPEGRQQLFAIVSSAGPLPSSVVTAVFVAIIAKWGTHHARSHRAACVAGAVCGFLALQLGGRLALRSLVSLPDRSIFSLSNIDWTFSGVSIVAFTIAASLGYRIARKNQNAWLIGRIVKQLSAEDQETLIELATSLPRRTQVRR